jgi:glucose/arabinose dehydrogenase
MVRIFLLASLMALLFPFGSTRAQEKVIETKAGGIKVETLARGLEHPWSLAFLPDGRMLVTERPGRLRMIGGDGEISQPLRGVPEVFAEGQGGLLEVVLDPDFGSNRRIYLSYAEAGDGGASTAVARGRLAEGVRCSKSRSSSGSCRKWTAPIISAVAWCSPGDGTLFVTLGERFKFDPAQDLSSHLGKIVRIKPDGSIPPDNPFVGDRRAKAEIWSYGHRNIEGGALNPSTGVLWIHEMGPLGGDELNIPRAGQNYGWPLVSWGRHYDGTDIPDPPTRPDLVGSVHHWTPVISPSGMIFYTGNAPPEWKGNLLIGGLSSLGIVRLTLKGDEVAAEERLSLGGRIRDVRQGPDGAVYALTDEDDGRLLRLTPWSPPTVGSGRQ